MDLRHLATFQAVVKEGSFLRAAEKLEYAQSTVTLHIQQLESELGVQLFERQGKKIQLTEAGRTLQEHAAQMLGCAEVLKQTMADLSGGEAGHIRIGSIEPTASERLTPLLVHFCQARPRLRLTLEVAGTCIISKRVATGDLDLGICSPPPAHLGLSFEPLFVEPMALLLPEKHPLATAETVQAKDLPQMSLLLTERSCAYREVVEKALLKQGANPYSGIEISSIEALKRAVQGGLGIAVVPVLAATPPPPGTVLREIPKLEVGLSVGIIYRADGKLPTRSLEILLSDLRKCLRAR